MQQANMLRFAASIGHAFDFFRENNGQEAKIIDKTFIIKGLTTKLYQYLKDKLRFFTNL